MLQTARAPLASGLATNLLAVSALALAMPGARAQSTQPAGSGSALEEVVVTAQRREQSAQDVPISVQILSGEALSHDNVNSLNALSQKMPSVQAGNSGARSSLFFIRGVGSGGNQAFDQSVGVFIDDIYHGRSRMSAASFLDLERVEILKGPQSTFFGNNAIAGAFNVVTRKPGPTLDGSVRALYGEHGNCAAEVAAGGPIGDKLGVRVAATANGKEGWLKNVTTGRTVPAEDALAGRITLSYAPSDAFAATLKIEGSQYDQQGALAYQGVDCPARVPFVTAASSFCAVALAQQEPMGLDVDRIARNPGEGMELDTAEYVLTANYYEGDHTFTAVTGYYDYRYDMQVDLDFTAATLLNASVPEDYRQFSQELRVTSPAGRTIEYVAGVYYQSGDFALEQNQVYYFVSPLFMTNPAFAALVPYLPIGQHISFTQDEQSYAVFGSLTWNATDRLKLTAGLRGSWVEKDFTNTLEFGTAMSDYGDLVTLPANLQALPGAVLARAYSPPRDSRKDDAWLPSANIQYRIAPQVMTYVSYAKGFKAGGFNGLNNTGNPADIPFAPEHVDAFEVGLKSKWLGDRVLLNLAAFHSDYTDLQVSQNIATAAGVSLGIVRNAAESRSRGVELEGEWAVSDALRLTAVATYLESIYLDYKNVPPTSIGQLQNGPASTQDLSGRPTWFAPEWSGSLIGSYDMALAGDYRLATQVVGIYAAKHYTDPYDDPLLAQPSYWRLDGRVSLYTADGHWALDVIGRNLTERVIRTAGSGWPRSLGSTVMPKQEPRNLAVQVRYHW